MLILFVELNRLEYLPGVCGIRNHTYAWIGVFEDPIGLFGVDCGSSGSAGMLHFFWQNVYLESLLPFFE